MGDAPALDGIPHEVRIGAWLGVFIGWDLAGPFLGPFLDVLLNPLEMTSWGLTKIENLLVGMTKNHWRLQEFPHH